MNAERTLGGHKRFGPLQIETFPVSFGSNDKQICLRCGDLITDANDSGWEAFTEDGLTTQPICVFCDAETNGPGEKASF